MEIITESDFCKQSQESLMQREVICNSNDFDRIERCQEKFCKIDRRTFKLRSNVNLDICKEFFYEPVSIKSQYKQRCNLISKFYISGNRKTFFPNMKGVAEISQPTVGNNYLFCLPDTEQIEQSLAGEDYCFINIHLDRNFLLSFATGLEETLPKQLQLLIKDDSPQMFYCHNGNITPDMKTILWQIINSPYQGIIQQMYLEGKTLELLALQLAQWLEAEEGEQITINLMPDEIEKIYQAREILLSNQAKPPKILNLAQQVNIHHMKLKQGFKEIFGTTMFNYLHNYRMEMARNMLLEKKMNVTEVASSVGYSNSSQFAAAFKRKFGITPKICKKRGTKQSEQ